LGEEVLCPGSFDPVLFGEVTLSKIKSLARKALAGLDIEVIRKPPGSTRRSELSGLAFIDFLYLYVATRDSSNFFFVQVGAFDGKSNDPVHGLASKWRLKGLVVEPQPGPFQTLKENYKDCHQLVLENVAISTEDGERPLYTIRKDLDFLQYVNQAASFNAAHTQKLLKKHITTQASAEIKDAFKRLNLSFEECIEAQPVKTATLRSLLAKHGISRYDFLQIDTEGFDFEVLKMADLESNPPALVNYEHEHLKPGDRQGSWDYLRGLGYSIFTHEGDTAAYLPIAYPQR
jgi:FkbM family methyltransferase